VKDGFDEGLARRTDAYVEGLFVPPDDALSRGLEHAQAAGLPSINVSPNEGKLLHLIARIARASRVLEIGTLGGYSTTWLVRALPPEGRLVTLELDPRHAEVARANLARAGVADRVEILVGPASASLRALAERHEPPFDLVFIDADKEGYVEYLDLSLRLVRRGSVILADNTLRHGRVLEDSPSDPSARGIKAFNERIATDPRLDSLILPIIRGDLDGLSISIVRQGEPPAPPIRNPEPRSQRRGR
jgi:predicted O-methyltransferase YrrM